MKKVLLMLVVTMPFIFGNCSSDDDEKEFSINETGLILHSGEKRQLHATENAGWDTESNFVAKVDETGLVTGNHVGETYILANNGSETAKCKVEVVPVYHTYETPILEFGVGKSTIKSKETRTLNREEETVLLYNGENKAILGVAYLFENGTLGAAAAYISYSYAEETANFLAERYQVIGQENETFYFLNNDLKNTDKADLGITLSIEKGFLMVLYMPFKNNKNSTCIKSISPDKSYKEKFRNLFSF